MAKAAAKTKTKKAAPKTQKSKKVKPISSASFRQQLVEAGFENPGGGTFTRGKKRVEFFHEDGPNGPVENVKVFGPDKEDFLFHGNAGAVPNKEFLKTYLAEESA